MDKFTAKCYLCEKEFPLDNLIGSADCPHCKKSVDKERAYKYYLKVNDVKTEEKIVAHGELYKKVHLILDKADYYITHGDYDNAKAELNSALEITNADYNVWFYFVRVETKDFTDYRSTTYKEYLDKAYSCADEDAKQEIKSKFSDYYEKTQMSDAELESLKSDELDDKKTAIENGLKKLFPEYAQKEKSIKTCLLLSLICGVLLVATLVLAMIFNADYIMLASAGIAIPTYITYRRWYTTKETVVMFNDLIDLFDEYGKFDLSKDRESELLDLMDVLTGSFYDKDTYNVISMEYGQICVFLANLGIEVVNEFIMAHKHVYQNV